MQKSLLSEPVRPSHPALGPELTKCDVALHYDTAELLTASQCPECETAERHKQVLMNMYHLNTHALEIKLLVGELHAKRRSYSLSVM